MIIRQLKSRLVWKVFFTPVFFFMLAWVEKPSFSPFLHTSSTRRRKVDTNNPTSLEKVCLKYIFKTSVHKSSFGKISIQRMKTYRVPASRLLGVGGGGHSRQMATGLCEMEYAIGILTAYSSTSLLWSMFLFHGFRHLLRKAVTHFLLVHKKLLDSMCFLRPVTL